MENLREITQPITHPIRITQTVRAELWPQFEHFWDGYGKKVGTGACRKKWDKLDQETKAKIMMALPDYIEATPEKKYRKNPLTWLNQECWEDEIETDGAEQISDSGREEILRASGLI